jgi:membrane protease YdiL (CAAX protease family)
MAKTNDNYWHATKHPWACVLFVLPLLAMYELGLHILHQTAPESLRNGADVWLRSALGELGVSPIYGAPCLLVFVLLLWGLLKREEASIDALGVWIGMTIESAGFALLLLGLSQGLWQVLLRADNVLGQPSHRIAMLQVSSLAEPESMWGQVVTFLGAGIYEETLFRLLLFAALLRLFRWTDSSTSFVAFGLAALGSALLFAVAHHVGPSGEPFNAYVLSFRTFAGLYFAWLYYTRGFGIAVGAHAGYDVLAGVIVAG